MDVVLDDFLKEINELVPPKPKIVWKECFDESSGFTYYWNTETDEVTWEAPAEYKKQSKAGNRLYIPPPSEPKFTLCSLPKVDEVNVKIYKINESCPDSVKTVKNVSHKSVKSKDKDDKKKGSVKVSLISSYGSSSESENEGDKEGLNEKSTLKDNENDSEPSDFDDEVDILTQIQKKANDLKKISGEVAEVKKIETPEISNKGISLVPGYGEDSEDEFENVSVSTESKSLFPAAKNIDTNEISPPNEFNLIKNIETNLNSESVPLNQEPTITDEIDTKAFQRKRRIGVSLINTTKRKVEESENKESEKKPVKKVEYPGFKSGGILFGDVNNDGNKDNLKDEEKDDDKEEVDDNSEEDLVKEVKKIRNNLEEKLKFLCEGHPEALPVQVMIIQMETLFTAMCEDSLKPAYLKNWLNSTLEDLTKLEKDAAPTGWLLQWDRAHKRYYYHNQATGDSQWDYPQADAIRTEEAMDISMTPPHEDQSTNRNSSERDTNAPPPPPPAISDRNKSVSPPPPPIISKNEGIEQPLPPGVEEDPKQKINGKDGSFSSELSSFYSDIAAMESNLPQNAPKNASKIVPEETKIEQQIISEPPKKKKKVKVSSGLAMKKKGVSQMVEKWKNLQKNYD